MPTFRVRWEADVEEENVTTPEQAAAFVWQRYFRRELPPEPDSCSTFDVQRFGAVGWDHVDLEEVPQESDDPRQFVPCEVCGTPTHPRLMDEDWRCRDCHPKESNLRTRQERRA